MNQAERFERVEMDAHSTALEAMIPAAYTDSAYALQVLLHADRESARAHLFPGLGSDLTGQPYFVVRRA